MSRTQARRKQAAVSSNAANWRRCQSSPCAEFGRHQPGHLGRHLDGGLRVEEQRAAAAGEHVLDRPRHLHPHAPRSPRPSRRAVPDGGVPQAAGGRASGPGWPARRSRTRSGRRTSPRGDGTRGCSASVVTQVFSGRRASIAAWFTASSAMWRYVVHLPPATVSRPDRSMWMVWSRESAAVDAAPSARTSGRMPTDTLSTSSRVGARCRYWPAVSRMNATSSSSARGSSVGSANRRVGGADQRVAVPGDGEHHAAVARVRHHDGAPARQERPVEHEVDALARRDHRRGRRIGQAAHAVREGARRVDDHPRAHANLAARTPRRWRRRRRGTRRGSCVKPVTRA